MTFTEARSSMSNGERFTLRTNTGRGQQYEYLCEWIDTAKGLYRLFYSKGFHVCQNDRRTDAIVGRAV